MWIQQPTMHYRWSKMKWQYTVINCNLERSLNLVIPDLMLCSNTVKNPGTVHKNVLVKGFPVCYLSITYLHFSVWIKFSATYSACFQHIQYVMVEVDLSIFPNVLKIKILCTRGRFCGFRRDNYRGYQFTKV